MAETESNVSGGMPETDIEPLKEMLFTQQQLLQKLYAELDEEREASATATNEALSMILRLQGEKAAVKMEASQYKRLAEEKMCHAEESISVFEDLIYQKEMEIASLEFQIQAYRYKLISMGCSDLGDFENRFPENMLLQRNDHFTGEKDVKGNVRRLNSLPPMVLKDSLQKKVISERERSGIPVSDMIPKIGEENVSQVVNVHNLDLEDKSKYSAMPPMVPKDSPQKKVISERERWIPVSDMVPKIGEENVSQVVNVHNLDLEDKSKNSAGGDLNSYWAQIRKINDGVKETSHLKASRRSSLLLSQLSTGTTGEISALLDQVKQSENLCEREASVSSPYVPSAHDVFEVPESKGNRKVCEYQTKEHIKLLLEGKKRLRKRDSILEKTAESHVKEDADWAKKNLLCANHEHKLSKPGDEIEVDCQVSLAQPAPGVAEYQAKIQQLGQRIEQLERERNSTKQEISEEGEEEVKLLKEIHEQLNSIQSEMRSRRRKKSPPLDESPLISVMEAMLYFWL